MGIKKIDWKHPLWNKENTEAYQWCIKHGVKIYSVPCGKGFNNKTLNLTMQTKRFSIGTNV